MPFLFVAALVVFSAPASASSVRGACHTMRMRAESGVAWAGEADRPASVGYVDSTIYPIRVHYRRAEDADRAADVVLPAAEAAWLAEVDQMAWPPPAPDGTLGSDTDRFDYYLTNEDTYGGAWTWGPKKDVVADDDFYSIAAFVALDDRGITDADMPVFVAHEFNHALQYAIDGVEQTGFVWESTAEAMESFVVLDSDIYILDIPDFNDLPFESILFDGYSDEVVAYNDASYYEYGGSIMGIYLEDAFGSSDGTTLRDLWLALAQGRDADEPDYVDALTTIGGSAAPSYAQVYLGFTEWRMFIASDDDGAHYQHGGDWKGAKVKTEGALTLSTVDGTSVSPTDQPYELGASYWTITVDNATTQTLNVAVDGGAAAAWGVVVAAWPESGAATTVRALGAQGEAVTAALPLAGATRVMVGVANLGAADLDAEAKHPRSDFTLSFALSDTPGDTGGEDTGAVAGGHGKGGTGDEASGCGCASGGQGAVGAAVGLALVFGARRRGR